MSNRDFFASIDIGSNNISMLIAEVENNKIHVFANATGPSLGVKNGSIVDVEAASNAVTSVINKAKKTCNETAKFINTNISDLHLTTSNQSRQISFDGKSKVIEEKDVKTVIQNASAGSVAANKIKLDPIVHHFIVDDQIEREPIGLEAEVFWAQVHLTVVSKQAFSGVTSCLKGCSLGADTIVLDSIASSVACITQEEKDEGVCMLDMGAGVSNISVFSKGGVVFSYVFKIGGNLITEKISQAYNTSFEEAERLKLEYGVLQPQAIEDVLIQFEQIDSSVKNYLSLHELISIIESSYKEICTLVKKTLKNEKLDRSLKSGFIVTGGASKIENCEKFLLKEFKTRTKIAKINRELFSGNEDLLNNINYFSAFGLLTYGTFEAYLQETEQVQKSGLLGTMKELFDL